VRLVGCCARGPPTADEAAETFGDGATLPGGRLGPRCWSLAFGPPVPLRAATDVTARGSRPPEAQGTPPLAGTPAGAPEAGPARLGRTGSVDGDVAPRLCPAPPEPSAAVAAACAAAATADAPKLPLPAPAVGLRGSAPFAGDAEALGIAPPASAVSDIEESACTRPLADVPRTFVSEWLSCCGTLVDADRHSA